MKFLLCIFAVTCTLSAQAASLEVADLPGALATSYTSDEFNGPIPWWIVKGKVVSKATVRDVLAKESAIACASWMMNFSDNKSLSKSDIQDQIFRVSKNTHLWKIVSGRPIYVDESEKFALSFVCVSRDVQGNIIEVDDTDFAAHVEGIFIFH